MTPYMLQSLLKLIFSDLVFGLGVPFLVTAGGLLLSDEFRRFRAAKVCFYLAAAWICGRILMWSVFTSEATHVRIIATFLAFGVVGVCLSEAVRATNHREGTLKAPEQEPPKPPPIQQNSSGSTNSPNINVPGNNNTVTVTIAPPATHPPKKGVKTTDIAEGSFLGSSFRESQADSDLIRVSVGGFTAGNSRGNLKKGMLVSPIASHSRSPITVGMDKYGKLIFTCKLIGGDEEHPFEIEISNNVFRIANGLVQKNYNDKALEIADDGGKPLFQVIQEGPNNLRINGIFVLEKSAATGEITRVWAWGSRTSMSPERPEGFDLKPIFKYPSWKYLGQYAD